MAELTLLVNSTDATLLNGSVVAPVATSGAAAGGFAGVLGKRLMQSESVVTKESTAQMDGMSGVAVAETGEVHPMEGNPLPLAVSQNTAHTSEVSKAGNPVLDASLLSAIAQGASALSGQTVNTPLASTMNPVFDSAQVAAHQPVLSHLAVTRSVSVAEGSTLPAPLNTTLSSQASILNQQNMSPALPNATQDAQRASASPLIPAMLNKSVSTAVQQTLARTSLNAGKAHYLRADMLPATGSVAVNMPHNSGVSSTLTGANSPIASTMRMDMFAAAMGTATQAGANTELRLPVTAASSTAPVSLIATGTLADDTNNLLTGMPRLPGATVNGTLPILTVPTPVGQPAWASELGQRVTWLANSELREAQLKLNPRSLGAVDVRIVYGPEQQLNVSFSAANPAARDALDASLPRLREMFEQQGLHLADANISHEPPAERGQHDSMNGNESLTSVDGQVEDEALMDAASLHSSPSSWLSEGMLDAYA